VRRLRLPCCSFTHLHVMCSADKPLTYLSLNCATTFTCCQVHGRHPAARLSVRCRWQAGHLPLHRPQHPDAAGQWRHSLHNAAAVSSSRATNQQRQQQQPSDSGPRPAGCSRQCGSE
jgi:hypothetical protein